MPLRKTNIGKIPVAWVDPGRLSQRRLVIWLTGFSGSKEAVEPQLHALADRGFVALSFDPYQHGERRIEPNPQLVTRVRGNIRRYFWPILTITAEEVTGIIDWAQEHLDICHNVGIGGVSMGGDISVAAAGVDHRIRAVSACVATPDWMRPGSFEPPGEPDALAQSCYERRNPLTHLELYRHLPAIAFQSGAVDRQVPPDGGERFVTALKAGIYRKHPDRLQVNLNPGTPHAFIPAMLDSSIAWFDRFIERP